MRALPLEPEDGVEIFASPVHGNGLYATKRYTKGSRVCEYKGERISEAEADRRWDGTNHTVYFQLKDGRNIIVGDSAASWMNHSCDPNCRLSERKGRVFAVAVRHIQKGEELVCDYHLTTGDPVTPELIREYPCHCGSKSCRGTMLEV